MHSYNLAEIQCCCVMRRSWKAKETDLPACSQNLGWGDSTRAQTGRLKVSAHFLLQIASPNLTSLFNSSESPLFSRHFHRPLQHLQVFPTGQCLLSCVRGAGSTGFWRGYRLGSRKWVLIPVPCMPVWLSSRTTPMLPSLGTHLR